MEDVAEAGPEEVGMESEHSGFYLPEFSYDEMEISEPVHLSNPASPDPEPVEIPPVVGPDGTGSVSVIQRDGHLFFGVSLPPEDWVLPVMPDRMFHFRWPEQDPRRDYWWIWFFIWVMERLSYDYFKYQRGDDDDNDL